MTACFRAFITSPLARLEDIAPAIRSWEARQSECLATVRRANALASSLTYEYAVAEYMIR